MRGDKQIYMLMVYKVQRDLSSTLDWMIIKGWGMNFINKNK